MKGFDLSFSRPPLGWWQARRAEGFTVMFQCLWTGGYAGNDGIRAAAPVNLRNARLAEFDVVGGYANATPPPWWPLEVQIREIKANAGSEWAALDRIAIDLEISGLTMARAFELANALAARGKRTDIGYTARWFWVGHMGNSQDPRWLRFKLWNANYDWNPDIDFGDAPYGPWKISDLVGEQYQGTTQLDGYAVDLNTFIDNAFTLSVPVSPQEDDMPDPIFKTPSGRRAQVGAAGKHGIGMDEHEQKLVEGGAKVVSVSEVLFDAITNVTEISTAATRRIVQEELKKLPAFGDPATFAQAVRDKLKIDPLK